MDCSASGKLHRNVIPVAFAFSDFEKSNSHIFALYFGVVVVVAVVVVIVVVSYDLVTANKRLKAKQTNKQTKKPSKQTDKYKKRQNNKTNTDNLESSQYCIIAIFRCMWFVSYLLKSSQYCIIAFLHYMWFVASLLNRHSIALLHFFTACITTATFICVRLICDRYDLSQKPTRRKITSRLHMFPAMQFIEGLVVKWLCVFSSKVVVVQKLEH